MILEFKVNGDAMRDAFNRLPSQVSKLLRVGVGIGLRSVQREARTVHRFVSRSGAVDRSVDYTVDQDGLGGRVYLDTGVAQHGPLLHQGTGVYGPTGRPIVILPVNKTTLRWVGPGGRFMFARRSVVRGIRPDPFLYRAAAKQKPEFRRVVAEKIGEAIKLAGLGGAT